jgi:ribosomal protein S18 acetylase RimI-like enzyme
MNAAVTIRGFEERDLEGVIAVARDLQHSESLLYARMKSPQDIGADYFTDMRKAVEKHQGSILVAELAGKVVGYCTLLTACDSSDDTDEVLYRYSYVWDLGVAAQHRSAGIGRILIEEAERIARAAGIPWLRLNVLAANAAARRFYSRLGFADHLITVEKAL